MKFLLLYRGILSIDPKYFKCGLEARSYLYRGRVKLCER